MIIVKVALPVPDSRLYSYKISDSVAESAIGRRVLVPFNNRKLTGIIVEKADDSIENIREVIQILDDKPIFSEEMLQLSKWMAEYYFCTWGEVLKAALPLGLSPKSEKQIRLIQNISDETIHLMKKKSALKAELLELLKLNNGVNKYSYLENKLESSQLQKYLSDLEQSGIISIEEIITKESKAKIIKAVKLANIDEEELLTFYEKSKTKAPKQYKFITDLIAIKDEEINYLIISEIDDNSISSVIGSLRKKGIIEIMEFEVDRTDAMLADTSLASKDELALALTEEQEFVLEKIVDSIDQESFKPFLLHGVTGSGKTLIYLHAIKSTLKLNKTVLILVPEISLTPQLIDRFESAFRGQVAILHSRMQAGERYDSWKSILEGRKKIVLGVRSAIFAPLQNLGLIIVDEEHEQSFKQDDPAPRYQARDSALVRAKLENAVIVLGSATPSLESYQNAISGKFELLEILSRADNAELPLVTIIDLSEARKKAQVQSSITNTLLLKIEEKVERKEGVILFINRRGFATVLQCKDCGYVSECEHCSVVLTYHKATNSMKCHYCGTTYEVKHSCPECGNPELIDIGLGTQRIEEEIQEYFEQKGKVVNVARMDLDTTSKKGSHKRLLLDFASGKTDILIGTQMVAKGLDFDRVTLVGVINPDIQMFVPDFRAYERTFQLLTQVSGRAGRSGEKPGEVLIQTSRPNSFAINSAIHTDYKRFYETEIKHRESAKYPPFSRFCVIEFSGADLNLVRTNANEFRRYLPADNDIIKVLGPVEPQLFKLRDEYRMIIVIKGIKEQDISGKKLRYYLHYALEEFKKKSKTSKVKIVIDIDSNMAV
jgi:primosomal protein N' (replication factor Y)